MSRHIRNSTRDSLLASLQYYVRHFPIDKGKGRLIQLLCRHLLLDKEQRLTSLSQVPIRMRCDISQHIQRDIFFWGTYHYEKQLLDLWLKRARESQVIFDVGANIGIYSLYAAYTNSQSRVHAFEPTTEISNKLLEHIKLNNLANITVNRIAVGKTDETGYVHECRGDEDTNEGMNFVTTEVTQLCQPTSIRSLDSYCNEHNISHIDLMKMDIEGGEYNALLGMQGLLAKKAISCIFMELVEWAANRYNRSTADIKRILFNNGYYLYEIDHRTLKPIQFEGIHQGESNILAFAKMPESISLSE